MRSKAAERSRSDCAFRRVSMATTLSCMALTYFSFCAVAAERMPIRSVSERKTFFMLLLVFVLQFVVFFFDGIVFVIDVGAKVMESKPDSPAQRRPYRPGHAIVAVSSSAGEVPQRPKEGVHN